MALPAPSGKIAAVRLLATRMYRGRRNFATAAAAVLALGLGYHVMFGHNGLTAYRQKMQDTKALEAQMRSLQRENDLLKGHVGRLQSDPDAIEHQAREELHYTRAGEVIYALPAAGTPAALPNAAPAAPGPTDSPQSPGSPDSRGK